MGRSSFVRNVGLLGGGTGAAQLFLVLATPLITRLYEPGVIGVFGVFMSAVTFGIIVAPAGYHVAIVSADSKEDAAALTMGSSVAVGVNGLLGCATVLFLISRDLLGFGSLPLYAAPLVAVAILVGAGFETMRFWFVRTETFLTISWITAVQGAGRAFAPVAFGVGGLGLPGLVLGDLIGRCLGVFKIARLGVPQIHAALPPPRWPRALSAMRTYKRYPQYQLPSKVVNTAAQILPVPLVMDLYGPYVAGLFVMVERLFGVPTTFVGRAVGDVLHARLTARFRTAPDRVLVEFMKVGATLLAAGLLGAVAVVLFGEQLFALVLGSEWRPAGEIAAVVAPWAAARFTVSPLSRVIFIYDALRSKLVYDALALGSVAFTFWLAQARQLDSMATFQILSGLNVVGYTVYGLLLIWIIRSGSPR